MSRVRPTAPREFVVVSRDGNYLHTVAGADTKLKALNAAKSFINDRRLTYPLGIYQLTSVVKAKSIDLEVEEVRRK